jgi:hypothetical protein
MCVTHVPLVNADRLNARSPLPLRPHQRQEAARVMKKPRALLSRAM